MMYKLEGGIGRVSDAIEIWIDWFWWRGPTNEERWQQTDETDHKSNQLLLTRKRKPHPPPGFKSLVFLSFPSPNS